jgi:uncharacterized protein (DUF1499 family)
VKVEFNREKKPAQSLLLLWSLGLAVGFLVISVLAGFGHRFGWWDFKTGFSLLRYGFFGAVFTFFLVLAGLYKGSKEGFNRRYLLALPSLLISLILIIVPLKWLWAAKHLPRIHDITTDMENPPSFVAILPLRKGASNSAIYGGKAISEEQKRGYPDLKPVIVPLAGKQAFQIALQTAQKMGWDIVDANPSEGRIEATDTTFWFRFKDDIVIRIIPAGGSSRIDLRSVSRVGISDVGTNAKRIRAYFTALEKTISSPAA